MSTPLPGPVYKIYIYIYIYALCIYGVSYREGCVCIEFWRSREITRHMSDGRVKGCAVLVVGGWYDCEDPRGPFATFYQTAQVRALVTPPTDLTPCMLQYAV